jgi:hypothetical protein
VTDAFEVAVLPLLLRLFGRGHRCFERLVDKDAQEALLTDLPFNVNDLNTRRSRRALRCVSNAF